MREKEIYAEVVGVINERVIYVQFFKDGEPISNNLWKLVHPGNLEVERWTDSIVEMVGNKVKVNRTERTKKFFDKCVFPVKEATPNVPLEAELIEKYGANSSEKPTPDSIHPRLYGAWLVLLERFLGGTIWDDVEEYLTRNHGGGD